MRTLVLIIFISLFGLGISAEAGSPFSVSAVLDKDADPLSVVVSFDIPEGHYLYADQLTFEFVKGAELQIASLPEPKQKKDTFTGEIKGVYKHPFKAVLNVVNPTGVELVLTVHFQGCDEEVCFFPETHEFVFSLEGSSSRQRAGGGSTQDISNEQEIWQAVFQRFRIERTATGYMSTPDFLAFVKGEAIGSTSKGGVFAAIRQKAALFAENPVQFYRVSGAGMTIIIILIGGILLNLTPCVLPMIPVNLAIIGAGAQSSSRTKGFVLGGTYGLGIALAYGLMGVVVVLTGSRFGVLNASVWFNVLIAVIFALLAMAMFDVVHIDFTRFQNRFGSVSSAGKGGFVLAFLMGILAALLAGACVAPVVIAVLLLSGTLYTEGITIAILFPFMLGLGMALPWPFAGAGLSFMPKPGKWMVWVKYGFGLLILILAFYYGLTAYHLYAGISHKDTHEELFRVIHEDQVYRDMTDVLHKAEDAGKPVFIDFAASWCKNCTAMDKTTFKNPEVVDALKGMTTIKFMAEHPGQEQSEGMLKEFNVLGLPTYVIMVPVTK